MLTVKRWHASARWGLLFLFLSFGMTGMACEIEMKVNDKDKKASYSTDEEIVVEVKVELTHRHCKVEIGDTKIASTGCKVMSATKWVESKPGTFERKLKVKVLPGKDSEMKVTCTRKCDKDGGFGSIELKRNI